MKVPIQKLTHLDVKEAQVLGYSPLGRRKVRSEYRDRLELCTLPAATFSCNSRKAKKGSFDFVEHLSLYICHKFRPSSISHKNKIPL